MSKGKFERLRPRFFEAEDFLLSRAPEEDNIILYAYFKQSTQGDAMLVQHQTEFIDQMKWHVVDLFCRLFIVHAFARDAWKSLEGTSEDEAFECYCNKLVEMLKDVGEDAKEHLDQLDG
ncbi:hypothetical protein DL96DRAFT_1788149 [Flagelloscypha sp. PMI_526]|nr:hypothetical protein DL96DRAFT_1788149 [Flagelloscypha sp. PMI_526]